MHCSAAPVKVWIKLVFLFQSASMTVLYPYINLHMKSLGMTIEETAIGEENTMKPIKLRFQYFLVKYFHYSKAG